MGALRSREVNTNLTQETQDYKSRIKHNPDVAEDYKERKPRKHQGEMKLVRRGFEIVKDVTSVLDAPCGVGRATILLASMGFITTGLDLGEGAVTVARRELAASGYDGDIVLGDLENLQYDDKSFDAILCFRVYHHFPSEEIRHRIITELCRVAGKYVLISYFSPYSYTSIKRALRARFTNRKSIQHATPLDSIIPKFDQHRFELVQDIAIWPFLHTLHLAVFKRGASDQIL